MLQLGVRSGKNLAELTDSDSNWQHFWTNFIPTPRQPLSLEGTARRKGGKGDGRDSNAISDTGGGSASQAMQAKKDRQIADLQRQLAKSKRPDGGGDGSWGKGGGRGGQKRNRWT